MRWASARHTPTRTFGLRPAIKPDGEQYYEYVLIDVDDLLSMSHDARAVIEEVREEGRFKIKGNKIKEPSTYLGATVEKKQMNGYTCWTMSSTAYIKAAIANVAGRQIGASSADEKRDHPHVHPIQTCFALLVSHQDLCFFTGPSDIS